MHPRSGLLRSCVSSIIPLIMDPSSKQKQITDGDCIQNGILQWPCSAVRARSRCFFHLGWCWEL